jgi:hypothetical protein
MIEQLKAVFTEFDWVECPHRLDNSLIHTRGALMGQDYYSHKSNWVSVIKSAEIYEVWSSYHDGDPTHHDTAQSVLEELQSLITI